MSSLRSPLAPSPDSRSLCSAGKARDTGEEPARHRPPPRRRHPRASLRSVRPNGCGFRLQAEAPRPCSLRSPCGSLAGHLRRAALLRRRHVRSSAPRATRGKANLRRSPDAGGSGLRPSQTWQGSVGSRGGLKVTAKQGLRRPPRLRFTFRTDAPRCPHRADLPTCLRRARDECRANPLGF